MNLTVSSKSNFTSRAPRGASKTVILVIVGLVAAAGAAGAYWWFRGRSSESRALAQKLPGGMSGVGGIDVGKITHGPWVQQILDKPIVTSSLEKAKTQFGVDVMAMKAIVGGVKVKDNTLHALYLVTGGLDRAKIEPLLKGFTDSDVEVAGKVLRKSSMLTSLMNSGASGEFPGLFGRKRARKSRRSAEGETTAEGKPAALDAEGKPLAGAAPDGEKKDAAKDADAEPKKPTMPKFAELAIGFIDDNTFAVGSVELLESYAKGEGASSDDKTLKLLDDVDKDAVLYGVGSLETVIDAAKMFLPAEAMKSVEEWKKATMVGWMTLDTSVGLVLQFKFETEDHAKQVEGMVKPLLTMGEQFFDKLPAGSKPPTLERKGSTVEARVSVALPDPKSLPF